MHKNDLIKLSFLGDIMCEKPLLKASHIKDNEYNFDEVFKNMKPTFEQSDYVVGNLETISATNEFGYTNHLFSFNTPQQFVQSIKNSGIDMVTTATNHSLDRGLNGLKENIKTLNKFNLDYTGTYLTKKERDSVFVKNIHGIKIAFLNYTYGTNTHINGVKLDEDETHHIGLLKSQEDEKKKLELKKRSKSLKSRLSKVIFIFFTLEQWLKLKKLIGISYYKAHQDNELSYIDEKYLSKIREDISKAKKNSDLTVVCMHSGGQFHSEPGKFSEYMMEFMNENGADIVIGNHPHVVQKSENFNNQMFGAYSLGNFSISPSSVYVLHDDLPEYSIMLHMYLNKHTKNIKKITFSILKIEEDSTGGLTVFPVNDLIKKQKVKNEKQKTLSNATIIYNRFLGTNISKIKLKEEFKMI